MSSARWCGPVVREQFGGIDTTTMVMGLAHGELPPSEAQSEMAAALRHAARLRAQLDCLGGAA
jgi:hypothetical protein